jgi:hypothetical protein
MVQRSPAVLVVVTLTTHLDCRSGQLDLFDDRVPAARSNPPRNVVPPVESNDVDLLFTVAGNALRCGYLLARSSERVYARNGDRRDEVVRVPRYEDDAVHQLLHRRWLTRGSPQHVTCGAVALSATSVLVPHDTRQRVARWRHLQRPPHWPHTPTNSGGPAATTPGRVTRLDDYRRTR